MKSGACVEAGQELYDITRDIIEYFTDHPTALVLHLTTDILNAHLDFLDDVDEKGKPTSTIRINIPTRKALKVDDVKSLCGNHMPIDMYTHVTSSVYDTSITDFYPCGMLYLNILLHEIGHLVHGLELKKHGIDIVQVNEYMKKAAGSVHIPAKLHYTLNPIELNADAFMYRHLKAAREMFGDRLYSIFNANVLKEYSIWNEE